ncbi:hypothetical protein ACXYTP_19105 [Tsukamurella ocularis]|uniref:hypothetical protein n=1 Tax=Tsukamurella ocularis TaxID=1970234 RepID=UPI0039EF3CB1
MSKQRRNRKPKAEPPATPEQVITSRIHAPGCAWIFTHDCAEALAALRSVDHAACDQLEALPRAAERFGLPAENNGEHPDRHHESHRCPVGSQVPNLKGFAFSETLPMPWAGELKTISSDGRTLYRLYFIEGRPDWPPPTDLIIGAGVGQKPVDENTAWCSDDQTEDMHSAMVSGVTYCTNTGRRWRRWNTA